MLKNIFTVATCLTFLRIFLIPVIVFYMYEQQWLQAFVVFVCAAITDALDGAVARLRHEQTVFGACLDAVADKLLLIATFASLATVRGDIPVWFVFLVVAKELVLVGSVIAIYILHGTVNIRPTMLGKMTTVVQMFFVVLLIGSYFFDVSLGGWQCGIVWLIAAMLVVSYIQYACVWLQQG